MTCFPVGQRGVRKSRAKLVVPHECHRSDRSQMVFSCRVSNISILFEQD